MFHRRDQVFQHRIRDVADKEIRLRVPIRQQLIKIRGIRNHTPYSGYQEPTSSSGYQEPSAPVDNFGCVCGEQEPKFGVSGTILRRTGTRLLISFLLFKPLAAASTGETLY